MHDRNSVSERERACVCVCVCVCVRERERERGQTLSSPAQALGEPQEVALSTMIPARERAYVCERVGVGERGRVCVCV